MKAGSRFWNNHGHGQIEILEIASSGRVHYRWISGRWATRSRTLTATRGYIEANFRRSQADAPPLTFTYKNHRGEVATRRVQPGFIYFGTTDWHPTPCWLMRVHDLDKGAPRDFDLREIRFDEAPRA